MPNAIHALVTESRNPFSTHIDQLSTLDMLAVINQEDQKFLLLSKKFYQKSPKRSMPLLKPS